MAIMSEVYVPQLHAPVMTVLPPRRPPRGNARTQRIFADSRTKRMSSTRLYVESNASPLSRTVWQSSSSSLRVSSPLAHLPHLQPNRRELWQESTPTSHTFPHIRPSHRRRLRSRSTVRSKGSRLRKDLSQTLLSAYDAARAPFRHAPSSSSRRPGIQRKNTGNNNNKTAQESFITRPARPQTARTTTRTVEITGPLNSPSRSGSLGKKLFRQRSFKSSLASPLTSHPPSNMAFRRSVEMNNRPATSDAPVVPRRSPARSRDSFNRAKIHVRRPPKGITHWFDALDEDSSDGDYPEVVEPPASAPPEMTTFQPSLGPHRARAAPTSFVSQSSDLAADYFSYSHHVRNSRRRKNSAVDSDSGHPMRFVPDDLHSRSILDLSSDEDGIMVRSPGWDMMTPSPGPHNPTFLRRATMQRKGSATPFTPGMRQSMASMQTTLTSATIPFMLRISPMIDSSTPPVPFIARHPASYMALTGRPPTADSKSPRSPTIRQSGRSQPSTASMFSASNTLSTRSEINYVAVTSEEMAVLEMMRRKRAGQADIQQFMDSTSSNFQDSITEEDEMPVPVPSPLNPVRKNSQQTDDDASRSHSLASTVTLESGENITFPTPPLPGKSPLLSEKPRGRNRSVPLKLGDLPTPPPTASYWSPEIPTPYEEIPELEAIPYTGPLPIRTSTHSSNASKRTSRYSLLRPAVFNGAQSSVSPMDEPESPFFIPKRDSSLRDFSVRDTSVRNSATTAFRSPRRTRTYDSADATVSDFNLDFSELSFSPVPNLLSPSLGGLLTSTIPTADWPGSAGLHMTARSPSCASHSPSLTDGGSLSGRSRSEVDTPTKEPGLTPAILGEFGLNKLTSRKLKVVGDLDGEIDGEILGGGRYAIEIRKLAEDEDEDGEHVEHERVDGDGKRKASTEVLDAWNALGGYPIH
ncbi:hypothetical protein K461DRAFT_118313 [Myriangium duriaei CBS 260.36]|uniref:Uncharacterized protein n=1 Tax=Myriangium duriaei CBS 260.36 TaxID=1168546 RepID=A0A9P4J2F2_9PEZI|nr:hypothetical protein K461DRAFT_118313 [Myriangium duriaei CBS 260.36]